MTDDPYGALGLTKEASADKIKKAYRRIAKTCHPDLNPDDPDAVAKFKAAAAAYDLLKDPEQRARFDRGEIDATGAERPERQFYRDYAEAGGNPYRQGHRFDEFDASDIFAEFMRRQGRPGAGYAGRGGAPGFHARGADRHYTLEVPFLDAARGGRAQIRLPEGGALEVTIPEGAADGQTLRLRGKGAPGYGEGAAGDALITLAVAAHPVFRREGRDIHVILPITFDEAVLGGKVAAPTIHGPVNLTIPAGASSGRTLRLRGRGVKGRGGTPGDQLVELSIAAPPRIDDELADFLRGWRERHGYDPRKGMKT
ncbi:MAG TPA: molecular chaperone DnaJ [Rhodobacteraceae bacterium]|nr:molecular chaperone DnaJ [Paracoccaceae bacterium]